MSLPTELLCIIFELACRGPIEFVNMESHETRCTRTIRTTRYRIATTCSRWKAVFIDLEILRRILSIEILRNGNPYIRPLTFVPPLPFILEELKTLHLARLRIRADIHDRPHDSDLAAIFSPAYLKAEYVFYKVRHGAGTAEQVPMFYEPYPPLPHLRKLSVDALTLQGSFMPPHLDLVFAPVLKILSVYNYGRETCQYLKIILPQTPLLQFMPLRGSIDFHNITCLVQSCSCLKSLRLASMENHSAMTNSLIELPHIQNLSL